MVQITSVIIQNRVPKERKNSPEKQKQSDVSCAAHILIFLLEKPGATGAKASRPGSLKRRPSVSSSPSKPIHSKFDAKN